MTHINLIDGFFQMPLLSCWCFSFFCKHSWSSLAAREDESQSDDVGVNDALLDENTRLRDLATLLQGRHHKMSMEVRLSGARRACDMVVCQK